MANMKREKSQEKVVFTEELKGAREKEGQACISLKEKKKIAF